MTGSAPLAFAVLIVLPAVAAGQGKATFGVKGGVNVATVKFEGVDYASRVGWGAGIFVAKSLNKSVGIRGEALFSQKGTKAEEEESVESTLEVTYVDIPVLLTVGPKDSGSTRFNLFTGPQFSFKTKAEVKTRVDGSTAFAQDVGDHVNSFDLAWVAGVGLEKGRWSADARYALGLTNIFESNGKFTNRVFSVMVGVRLSK